MDKAPHLKVRDVEDSKLLTASGGELISKSLVREWTPGKGFSFAMGK
jgi:hypothetical protein